MKYKEKEMKKVVLSIDDFRIIPNSEVEQWFEQGELIEFEMNDKMSREQKLAIQCINELLNYPLFIKMNALITRNYKLSHYFFDLSEFVMAHLNNEPFKLILESETLQGVYVRAYLNRQDLRNNPTLEETFKLERILALGPDQIYDVNVIRKASMELVLKKTTSAISKYEELDLNQIYLWDFLFGLA